MSARITKYFAAGCLLLFCLLPSLITCASEQNASEDQVEDVEDGLLEEFEFQDVDESLRGLFPDEKLNFQDTVKQILSGDLDFTSELLNRIVKEQLFYVLQVNRQNLIQMILIAVIAAVLSNFSNVFQSRQISGICFYALYLLLIALSLHAFELTVGWAEEGIQALTSFMSVFCPVYFVAVSVAKGSVTAVAFYNLVLFLIFLCEEIVVQVLLPAVHVFMMVRVLDFLSEESYMSRFSELLGTIVNWSLRTLLASIVGLNVVQGMINPAIDAVKHSAVTRSVEAVPGVGNVIGGIAEVAVGAAVLVKNGIGMAGAVLAVGICLIPLAQIGAVTLLYKLAAAMIQPISDPRISGCMEAVSEGCALLMKMIFTVSLLFLLTIAVAAMVTNSI